MSESIEARVERIKATLPETDQKHFEEMKRLLDALRMGEAIAYRGMWPPEKTVALLEKAAEVLEIPLDIWIEDTGKAARLSLDPTRWDPTERAAFLKSYGKEVIFCIPKDLEISESFRLLVNHGSFRLMPDEVARARKGLSPEERELFESLREKVEELRVRGSHKCRKGEKPERVVEILHRVESTIEDLSLIIWIEGREVLFKQEYKEYEDDDE